jgi:hypothetical protein
MPGGSCVEFGVDENIIYIPFFVHSHLCKDICRSKNSLHFPFASFEIIHQICTLPYMQRLWWSILGLHLLQSPPPIKSIKLTTWPANLALLHLDKIWGFCWTTTNLSSSTSIKDIQQNTMFTSRTRSPPFIKFKGVHGILHMIACYEFILGHAFILGSPVPLLGNAQTNHATTQWTRMMRNNNNGFLKIAGSSHNRFPYHHRLVLTVGAIVYYNLTEDNIGPP